MSKPHLENVTENSIIQLGISVDNTDLFLSVTALNDSGNGAHTYDPEEVTNTCMGLLELYIDENTALAGSGLNIEAGGLDKVRASITTTIKDFCAQPAITDLHFTVDYFNAKHNKDSISYSMERRTIG